MGPTGRVGRWQSSTHFLGNFLRIVVLDWKKNLKLRKLLCMWFFGDTRNSLHEKVTESVKFRGISRNYTQRNSAEFRRNFSQFRTEYGIDGSKKNRRNSVSTDFRGTPTAQPLIFCLSLIFLLPLTGTRGLQGDVVYLGWIRAPSYMSPNAGGGGGVAEFPPISTAVHVEPR